MKTLKTITNLAHISICAALFTSACSTALADRLISLDVSINGKPVHFIYDTGANNTVLFRNSAVRLGLKILPFPPTNEIIPKGMVRFDHTELCDFKYNEWSIRMALLVFDMPADSNGLDGYISWKQIHPGKNRGFSIDAINNRITIVPLPDNLSAWTKWKVVQGTPGLTMVSTAQNQSTKIGIDTGNSAGVRLSAKLWQKWRDDRKTSETTADLVYSGADGYAVNEVLRANKIAVENLTFKDIPVTSQGAIENADFGGADVVIGSFALTRIQVIVDPDGGFVYTAPIDRPTASYDYIRVGAVFPRYATNHGYRSAFVGINGPADKAGIRNGDLLLKVGDADVTSDSPESNAAIKAMEDKPAGSQVKLTLKRDDKVYETTVHLKDPEPVD